MTSTRELIGTLRHYDGNRYRGQFTGTVTYTGFMEGTGQVLTSTLSNACVPGQAHLGIRVLDTFASLTVAGRTGGAVVEIVGSGRVPATGIQINDNTVRILCGTGQLKDVPRKGL